MTILTLQPHPSGEPSGNPAIGAPSSQPAAISASNRRSEKMARAEQKLNVVSNAFPNNNAKSMGARGMTSSSRSTDDITIGPILKDPLIALAREMKQLDDRFQELDHTFRENGQPNSLRRTMRHIDDRQTAIRDFATTVQATSIEGALFQLSIAYIVIGEGDEPRGEDCQRQLDRLLFSAYSAIAKEAGIEVNKMYDSYRLNDHLNPWTAE